MLKAFRGQPFEHTHENKIFDALYDELAAHCAAREQDWTLLGNFYVGNRELDAVLVKPNALIVIDFKDYTGRLSLSEDGPWLIEDTASGEMTKVKGGASVNPLVQLRQNKFALVGFMEKVNKNCNWGHIAAIVLFHGVIEFDAQQIPGNCKPWLHIAGMRDTVRTMEAIVSREIHIEPKDIQYIVDWFELTPFIPAGAVKSRLLAGTDAASSDDVQQPTPTQQQALAEFSGWLQNPKGAFRLLGMASTGKHFLFPFLVGLIKKSGCRPILLAPNARHVGHYTCRDDIQQKSIYTWLYSQKPTRFEEKNGLKIAVHDVRKDIDITDVLPVLVNAHLMSDKNPGFSDRRYGSGYLITDFLKLMGEAPFVAIGDPYQMSRGSMGSLIPPDSITEITKTHLLNGQILAQQQDEAVQALQAHLVNCITKECFNLLPKFSGGNLEIVENDSDRRWTPGTETLSPKSVLLCSRREQANYVNTAVKTCRLGHSDPKRLGVGELVEFYTSTPILKSLDVDDLCAGPQWIYAGAIGIIDRIGGHIEVERQSLSGRQDPVIIRSEVVSCRIAGIGEVEIRYLVDFYEAEEAALSVDYMIALQVLARKKAKPFLEEAARMLAEYKANLPKDKNDPGYDKAKDDYDEAKREYDRLEYNVIQSQGFTAAARIRPAYAVTVHRAQGRQWPFARLSASPPPSGAAYTNEGYFRWLYTATTCAGGQLLVQDFPKIDSMLNTVVKRATNLSMGPISVKNGLQYDKSRIPTKEEEASVQLPAGFSDINLIPLFLELKDRLQNSSWRMIRWQGNNYQVLLTLLSDASDTEVKVRLDYDGSLSVTTISYPDARPKDRDAVNTLLARPFIPASQALAEALNGFLARVVPCGFQLLSAKETNYRIIGVLGKDKDKVGFELDADKKGMVSSVRLLKATTERILTDVESALGVGK